MDIESDDEAQAGQQLGSGIVGHKEPTMRPLGHRSQARKGTKNPEKNAAQRANQYAVLIKHQLDLREDIKIDILNRLLLKLSKEERAALRKLHAMEQEHYLASRDTVEFMEKECFTALNAIDLRACEALAARCMETINQRLTCDAAGKRRVIRRPPCYSGDLNPLTQRSNREQGILWEKKAVTMPRIFPTWPKVVKAADSVLEGRRLHLATDFDGAA